MPNEILLTILDQPTGKGRPRFNTKTGRAYTPTKTANAEARIRHAWDVAGRPTLPSEAPLTADISLYVDRPLSHYRADGSLNPKGVREWAPFRKKPDVDNAAKLVLDALEGYAYPRDVAIIELTVRRYWTFRTPPRIEVRVGEAA